MGQMSIINNIVAMNASRMLGFEKSAKAKSAEKLSSGYKINRAADDAAGLAISEKMRKKIRGLTQGTQNAQDGVSWVQIGDGALEEAHDLLHRMSELAVKSLNGTNSQSDRRAMDAELEQLKVELDRIGTTTKFNGMNIFSEHEPVYYQCEGAVKWDLNHMHVVTAGQNDITFQFRETEDGPRQEMTFTVPPGEYTTMELLDEIDDAINRDMGQGTRLVMNYTKDGYINATLEDGVSIDLIKGGLSYLMYDMYRGGSLGALIGTTIFATEDAKLAIFRGKNDSMTFEMEGFNNVKAEVKIDSILPDNVPFSGSYNREGIKKLLRDAIGKQITEYEEEEKNATSDEAKAKAKAKAALLRSLEVTSHGTGIKMGSKEGIVTGFKGNMFTIDGKQFTSVFYDNIQEGDVKQYAASFTGADVLQTTDARDEEHKKFVITDSNNQLTLEPNSMGKKETLTIPKGTYTLDEMKKVLQDFFDDNDFDLEVSITNGTTVRNGVLTSDTAVFKGLKIVSKLKGPDSKINIDETSSAYDTLFRTREYNYYGTRAGVNNETQADVDAKTVGGRTLSGISSKAQLDLTKNNNSFQISFTEVGATANDLKKISGTAKVEAKKYTSLADLVTAVQKAVDDACGGSGKITVSADNGKLAFKEASGEDINGSISLSSVSGNTGYATLFTETTYSYSAWTQTGNGSLTINPAGKASGTINITVNGETKGVKVEPSDDIATKIEKAFPPITGPEQLTEFDKTSAQGANSNSSFTNTGNGKQPVKTWSTTKVSGSGGGSEGLVSGQSGMPAILTIDLPLRDKMVLDSNNNKIELIMNKPDGSTGTVKRVLTLEEGECDPEGLAKKLQDQIDLDANFGTGFGGATVTYDRTSNRLTLTSRLPGGFDGSLTNIQLTSTKANNTLLTDLATTKTAARCVSQRALASNFTIGSGENLRIHYTKADGSTDDINLDTLEGKDYSPESFVRKLNESAQLGQKGITASLEGGKLVLTSDDVGSNVKIEWKTAESSAADAMFGGLSKASPANMVVNKDIQSSITIKPNENNFKIKVGTKTYNVTLKAGTYNRGSFLSMLQDCLADKEHNGKNPVPVKAYLSGGTKLGFTTNATGTGAKLEISYDSAANSAMKAIYGSTIPKKPGLDVVVNGDSVTLKAVYADGTPAYGVPISISSNTSGGLLPPKKNSTYHTPSSNTGYHSRKNSIVDGVSMSNVEDADTAADKVIINEWNKHLKFSFKQGKDTVDYDITLDEKEDGYTYDQLKNALTNKINNANIVVTVDDGGVTLKAANFTNQYQFSNLDGSFYYNVLSAGNEKAPNQTVAPEIPGRQTVEKIYAVGRKDIVSEPVEINPGTNNELSFDLTIDGTTHEINLELDMGKYNSGGLKDMIQRKIDEYLVDHNIAKAGTIVVGVGGLNSGVSGGNDSVALNFSMSAEIQQPGDGTYRIDGVRGNAAFDIFYQTDGKMIPPYIMGTKDVTKGVTIKEDETDLSFEVDGKTYTINLDPKHYTAKEIVDAINEQFEAGDENGDAIPLGASIDFDTGRLKISHQQVNEHEIGWVAGKAKNEVFFEENGDNDDTERHVQLSDENPDNIKLQRSQFSTSMIRIQSICITDVKYATKAVDRLSEAIESVSALRSTFGSTQNRLEHAINNNENKTENLTSAESVIRDTDVAKEMMRLANINILEQAGVSVLAQANKNSEIILGLLG